MNKGIQIPFKIALFGSMLCACLSCAKLAPPEPPLNLSDTTSHFLDWHFDYLGDGLGNEFLDVAVINDSSAYAVGSFYQNDSTGILDPILYNVAVWNGRAWTPKRLYYHFGTDSSTGEISSVFAFNKDDVWFGFGNLVHWNGKSYESVQIPPALFPSRANRIWGTADNDLYVVGIGGRIVHFNGATWQLLQTNTTLQVWDIWGAMDNSTHQQQILAVASSDASVRVISIAGNAATTVTDSGLAPCVGLGVWFVPNQKYYVAGAGIAQKSDLGAARWSTFQPGVVTSYASDFVRGRASNDIFVGGSYMELVHFNGQSWYNYRTEIGSTDGVFASIGFAKNIVVVVGFAGSSAAAAIGRNVVR